MNYKTKQLYVGGNVDLWLASWEGLKAGDEAPAWDKIGTFATVEVTGDADGVEILGSISGKDFFLLNDSDTLPLTFSSSGIKSCNDTFQSIKPKKIGPGVANVSMLIRRN